MLKKTKNTRTPFFFSLLIFLLFTSCNGFFTDNDLENKIKAAIDYANAPTSSFWIAADATAGTITPIGKISYKPTDYQNIKFKLKPEYQFIRWNFRYEEVQSSGKAQKQITNQDWWKDYIEIVNEEISEPESNGEITYSIQIQFKKTEENMLIEPICVKKPAIKSFVGEGLGLSGISRARELWFSFNSNIKDSVFYSQDEINSISGVTKVLQSESGIYGYETVENGETKTYFKNINITLGSQKVNVNSFYEIIYSANDFTIYLSPLDIIDFTNATENISITFSSEIKNSDSASLDETSKVITLNKVTDKAGIISVKLNSNAQDNYQSYFLGERIEQTFTEDENTQFVKWQVTADNQSSLAKLDYEINANTIVFWVKDEIKQSEHVVITAISAPRPSIKTFVPSNPNTAVERDSDIEIEFDKPINIKSFKNGYKILYNGVEVQYDQSGEDLTRNFTEPYWDDEKSSVIIKADFAHRLDVDSVKKVTVQIPSTIYYESNYTDEDGNKIKIYLGKDEARTYSVDSSTRDKAYIKFDGKGGADLFGTNNSEFTSDKKVYSVGEIQTIVCNEKLDYQLLGWINPDSNAIEITQINKNNNVYTYSFKILQPCGSAESPVHMDANVKERLRVNKIEPAMDEDGVEKDRAIKIYFNRKPNINLCRQKIAINCSGLGNVKDCFPVDDWTISDEATADGYLLTIKASPTNRINISSLSTVTVSFDANLYYTEGTTSIYYGGEGYSYEYKIKNETEQKVYVKFESSNATIDTSAFEQYKDKNFVTNHLYAFNQNSVFDLKFSMMQDYTFNEWKIKNKNGIDVDWNESPITITLQEVYGITYYSLRINNREELHTVGTETSPITLYVDSTFNTKISSITPQNSSTGVPCDTPFVIQFNKQMDFDSLSKGINCDIEVYDQYMNDISAYYSDPMVTLDADNKTVVTMKIKPDYSIKDIFGYNSTAVIQVMFNAGFSGAQDSIVLDTSGYSVTDDNNIVITYKINTQTEDGRPEFSSYAVYSTASKNKYVPYSVTTPWNTKNRVYQSLYYNFSFSDEDSGIDGKMDIFAQKIYDSNGNQVSGTKLSKTITFSGTTPTGTINFSTDFDNGTIDEDCMIKLDFVIYDKAGNTQSQTYYVAMDKNLDINKSFIYNRYFETSYNLSSQSDINALKEFASTQTGRISLNAGDNANGQQSWLNSDSIKEGDWNFYHLIENKTETYVYFRYPKLNFIKFNGVNYEDSLYNVRLYYGSNYDKVNSETSSYVDGKLFDKGDFHYAVCKINASKTQHTYVKICATDSNGGKVSRTSVIPRSPDYHLYDGTERKIVFNTGLNEIASVEQSHLSKGVLQPSGFYTATDSSHAIVRSNLTKSTNTYGYPNQAKSDTILDTDLTNGNANFLFASRYWLADKKSENYIFSKLYVDLRSPASDKLAYNSSGTNVLPSITGFDNYSFTSGGINSNTINVKMRIKNYTTYTQGTYAGTKILYKSTMYGNYYCDISSTGYITIPMTPGSGDRTYLVPHLPGYKSADDYFYIDRSYAVTGIDNTRPYLEFNQAKHLIDGALIEYSFVDYTNGMNEETHNGEVCLKFEYIFVPENDDFNAENFDLYNPIIGYAKKINTDGQNEDEIDYCYFIHYPEMHGYKTYIRVYDTQGNYYIGAMSYRGNDPAPVIDTSIPPLVIQKTDEAENPYKFCTCFYLDYFLGPTDDPSRIRDRTVCFNLETYNQTEKVWDYNYDFDYGNGYYRIADYIGWGGIGTTKTVDCRNGYTDGDSVVSKTTLNPNTYYRARVETRLKKSIPVYYYSTPVTCSYKSINADSNIATITCDKPAVYYCCYSFDDYGDDMDKWEVYGAHTSTGYTELPTRVDTSEVPQGMYYVIMAHFADNTTAMSSVMTK